MACRILVPQSGIEPGSQQWKCCILTTEPPGNSPQYMLSIVVLPTVCTHLSSILYFISCHKTTLRLFFRKSLKQRHRDIPFKSIILPFHWQHRKPSINTSEKENKTWLKSKPRLASIFEFLLFVFPLHWNALLTWLPPPFCGQKNTYLSSKTQLACHFLYEAPIDTPATK